jgi:hypothetical protein
MQATPFPSYYKMRLTALQSSSFEQPFAVLSISPFFGKGWHGADISKHKKWEFRGSKPLHSTLPTVLVDHEIKKERKKGKKGKKQEVHFFRRRAKGYR